MYTGLVHLHIFIFWIVLLSGLWANFRAWKGFLGKTPWTRRERLAGLIFSSALATQLLIGIVLYCNSPVVKPLMTGEVLGPDRFKVLFFGMMHPMTMFIAVVLGQIGFSVSKRQKDDHRKFQAAAVCYTAAFVLVFLAVPWPFLSYGHSLIP